MKTTLKQQLIKRRLSKMFKVVYYHNKTSLGLLEWKEINKRINYE